MPSSLLSRIELLSYSQSNTSNKMSPLSNCASALSKTITSHRRDSTAVCIICFVDITTCIQALIPETQSDDSSQKSHPPPLPPPTVPGAGRAAGDYIRSRGSIQSPFRDGLFPPPPTHPPTHHALNPPKKTWKPFVSLGLEKLDQIIPQPLAFWSLVCFWLQARMRLEDGYCFGALFLPPRVDLWICGRLCGRNVPLSSQCSRRAEGEGREEGLNRV